MIDWLVLKPYKNSFLVRLGSEVATWVDFKQKKSVKFKFKLLKVNLIKIILAEKNSLIYYFKNTIIIII